MKGSIVPGPHLYVGVGRAAAEQSIILCVPGLWAMRDRHLPWHSPCDGGRRDVHAVVVGMVMLVELEHGVVFVGGADVVVVVW